MQINFSLHLKSPGRVSEFTKLDNLIHMRGSSTCVAAHSRKNVVKIHRYLLSAKFT